MAVTLLRAYAGFASGAVVILPDDTEAALIAQGLATTIGVADTVGAGQSQFQPITQGGNVAPFQVGGQTAPTSTAMQGPTILPNLSLGNSALTAAGASSVHVAGTMNISEIYVPHWQSWDGLAVLNGTVVGTDNMLVALYNSAGALVANSALAGTVSAGASTFQNRDFLVPVLLAPGRYFCGVQCNGTTATSMKFIAANGVDKLTAAIAGTFGTVPATITVPTTFTTAVGCVCQLYT